ncbi:MAG: Shikimate dehydrogenase [Methanoregula sp. PtaU1.Bin051]|nr:MAG: Shikimate dehydrogenase [Methanoregula sp. PtaU1.Bin051]
MRRIVFAGFRGTGKTEVGKIVARRLNFPFIDTDALIEEKTGRSIPDIFHEDGEERFRTVERQVIAALPEKDVVIGTGGGVVTDPCNMQHLRKESVLVLLFADIDTIEKRLSRKPRPPLTNLPLREEIAEMMERRRQHYRAAADLCIDTSETTPAAAADCVIQSLASGYGTEESRKTALAFFSTGRINPQAFRTLTNLLTGKDRDPLTRIMGVAGYPAAHSRSPTLFNALFEKYGINCHYTVFEDPELDEIVRVARSIDARGLSVTIPFKQDVMEYLDEVDEHAAEQIGAVNTVVFACGSAIGYNTDWLGVRKPLASQKGAEAVLLGAGGAAAGAAYALTDLDMKVTILNRTPENARNLAERFGCAYGGLGEMDRLKPDIIVNATPLGMNANDKSPLSDDQLRAGMTVFDLVYTPPETPLIKQAQRLGCKTITGTEMFIEQAKEQFYLFFGIDVPSDTIREILA